MEKGEIRNLELQKPFELIPKQKGERAVKYMADFCYTLPDGKTCVEDTKGFRTKEYIIKRKIFKLRYTEITFIEI